MVLHVTDLTISERKIRISIRFGLPTGWFHIDHASVTEYESYLNFFGSQMASFAKIL